MPEYNYRAVTRTGVIVKNRIEASSRFTLIKALKRSDLLPISIEQVSYRSRRNKQKKQKRNVTNIDDVMKNVNTSQLKSKRRTLTTIWLPEYISSGKGRTDTWFSPFIYQVSNNSY